MTNPQAIRELNDILRKTFFGGRLMLTPAVSSLSAEDQAAVLTAVSTFNAFTEDNDPHGEHDFGAFEHAGERYFWKIDYYDRNYEFHSEKPADPKLTRRVLTIMRADEY